MNTLFQHRVLHKSTCYKESLEHRKLNNFCIVSADVFLSLSDDRVRSDAELSTNHHLVFCNFFLEKEIWFTRTCKTKTWEVLPNEEEGPARQGRRKDLCRRHIVFVSRALGMHGGLGRAVAVVQISCHFIIFSGMWTEMTRREDRRKNQPCGGTNTEKKLNYKA